MDASILLVDDSAMQRLTTRLLLEQEGWSVHTAAGVREAMEAFSVAVPDAVVSDLVMPESSGFELCEWLRGQHFQGPVALTSGRVDAELARIATAAGADLFLAKGGEPNLLVPWLRYRLQGGQGSGAPGECRLYGQRLFFANDREALGFLQVTLAGAAQAAAPKARIAPRILIVEHAAGRLGEAQELLRQLGHSASSVRSSEEAVSRFYLEYPELVLVRAGTVAQPALETVRQIRQAERISGFRPTSIVVFATDHATTEFLEAGASEVLSEEPDLWSLQRLVRSHTPRAGLSSAC